MLHPHVLDWEIQKVVFINIIHHDSDYLRDL